MGVHSVLKLNPFSCLPHTNPKYIPAPNAEGVKGIAMSIENEEKHGKA